MKQYTKLLAAGMLLLTAVVMVVATSFAWMTLSSSPLLQGIQVTIGGSGTVLVAPDVAVVQNGETYHYPGTFSESMSFSDYEQYEYLQQVGGLVPVSTADGQYWYISAYYHQDDEEVQSGSALAGELRPTTEFLKDNLLTYANLTAEELEEEQRGNYVYLDFWVVAPIGGYKLRVSTSSESAGSYVIDLMEPEQSGDTYVMTQVGQQTAASMRVGFLVNPDVLRDESMQLYTQSEGYNSAYTKLQGHYWEEGTWAEYGYGIRFTIYEPNGDLHPTVVTDSQGHAVEDGQYALTEPLGRGGVPTAIFDRLTVQLKNTWVMAGEEPYISQMFGTYLISKPLDQVTASSLKQEFYSRWLGYQLHTYIDKGGFVANTAGLYSAAGDDHLVDASELAGLYQAGATDDVYITELEKGVPQRIRLFIWLEGQDVDCINAASTGSFAVSIELSGSNAS